MTILYLKLYALEYFFSQLLGRASECLALLSAKLGHSNYFYGDKPSSLDALVFGYLEVMAQCPSQTGNAVYDKLQSCSNLLEFCRRLRKDYFPLMKESKSIVLCTRQLLSISATFN